MNEELHLLGFVHYQHDLGVVTSRCAVRSLSLIPGPYREQADRPGKLFRDPSIPILIDATPGACHHKGQEAASTTEGCFNPRAESRGALIGPDYQHRAGADISPLRSQLQHQS